MQLDNVNNLLKALNGGYSISSLKHRSNRKSKYVILYDMVLRHLLSKNKNDLIKRLHTLSSSLEKGLLVEDRAIINSKKHNDFYVSLHASSIYYQLIDYYIPDHPAIEYFKSMSSEELDNLLESLNYNDAWRVSNEIMSIAVLLSLIHI